MERDSDTPVAGAAGQSPAAVMSNPRSVATSRTLDGAPEASGTDDMNHESLRSEEEDAEIAPLPNPGANSGGLLSTSDARMPWLVLIGLGVGLLLAGLYLRFSTQPRAG